jgi:hypothetical protein
MLRLSSEANLPTEPGQTDHKWQGEHAKNAQTCE